MTLGTTGVLLVNLGTPDAPRPREVRRYLREFLGDPRVLDMPAALRWLLLEGVILPFRPRPDRPRLLADLERPRLAAPGPRPGTA